MQAGERICNTIPLHINQQPGVADDYLDVGASIMIKTPLRLWVWTVLFVTVIPVMTLGASIPDFRVHEEDQVGTALQYTVQCSSAPDGRFVSCWLDHRDNSAASWEYDIYFQLFDADGSRVGSNRMVSDVKASKARPAVAMFPDGGFAIAFWAGPAIYLQVFDDGGTAVGDLIYVKDGVEGTGLSLAVNGLGHMTLASAVSTDVHIQCLDRSGDLIGEGFIIDSEYALNTTDHQVVMTDDDLVYLRFLTDMQFGGGTAASICVSQFRFPGPAVSDPILLDEGFQNEEELYWTGYNGHDVSVHPDGYVAFAWGGLFCSQWPAQNLDETESSGWWCDHDTTFVTVFDPNGDIVVDKLRMRGEDTNAGDDNQNVLIPVENGWVFAVSISNTNVLAFRGFTYDGGIDESFTLVSEDSLLFDNYDLGVAGVTDDGFTLTYVSKSSSPNHDVVVQRLAHDWTPVTDAAIVNDDIGVIQAQSDMATDKVGYSLVVWTDNRSTVEGSIWGRIFKSDGSARAEDYPIYETTEPICDYAVTCSDNSRGAVVWSRESSWSSFQLGYRYLEQPAYEPDKITYLAEKSHIPFQFDVAMALDQIAICFGSDGYGEEYNIYLLIDNARDGATYDIVKASEFTEEFRNVTAPRIAIRNDGKYILTWQEEVGDWVYERETLMMRVYDPATKQWTGEKIDLLADQRELGDVFAAWNQAHALAVVQSDDFAVVWRDEAGRTNFRSFDADGVPLCDPVEIFETPPANLRIVPGFEEDFLISWTDDMYGDSDVFARRCSLTGELTGNKVMINSPQVGRDQSNPSLAVWNDHVFVAWDDQRESTMYPDVYARVVPVEAFGDCCGLYSDGLPGNTDCDIEGRITLSDLTRLIDRLYISRRPLCCAASGNVDGSPDGVVSLSDVARLIDHTYISRQPLAPCH